MAVPDKSQFVRDFVGPKLAIVGDLEDTRRHSFEAVRQGCVQVRKDDPRWGLLEKTGGANVNGFAADIWVYDLQDGTCQVVDIVGNAEGEADPATGVRGKPVPSWSVKDIRPIGQWKTPAGSVPTPEPEPEPDPGDDIAKLQAQIVALTKRVEMVEASVTEAEADAAAAKTLAANANRRIGLLKASGAINVPVVIDGLRARAKGDVSLTVSEG